MTGLFFRAFWQTPRLRFFTVAKLLLLVVLVGLEWFVDGWLSVLGLPGQLVTLVLYYVGITFAFNLAQSLLMSYYLRRHSLGVEYRDSFTIVLRRVSSLLAHVVFFVVALYVLGVNLSQFVTALSLFAVALVILFTEHLGKLINGLIIMFSKEFRVDDFIRVGELEGRIRDIGFLHVELHTLTGDVVYVPNSVLLNKETLNYSKKRTRSVQSQLFVAATSYESVEELVSSLRDSLFASFSDVDEDSFFYTLESVGVGEALLVLEFRISSSSWRRELEIQRFLVLEAVKLT